MGIISGLGSAASDGAVSVLEQLLPMHASPGCDHKIDVYGTGDVHNAASGVSMNPVSMGTTIIAMKYADGVILAADSRTSSGPIVVNRVARKITRILPNIFLLRSGSSADSQNLSTIIRYHALALRQQLRIPGKSTSPVTDAMQLDDDVSRSQGENHCYSYDDSVKGPAIKSLAKAAHNIVHQYREYISCSVILGGYDFVDGPQIFHVALGGTLVPITNFIAGGSGSGYITAFLRDRYRDGMPLADCLDLLKQAIKHAIDCDNSSGGLMRAVVVSSSLVKEFCLTF